jgi:iron-sulfur cluster assembly protein
MSSEANMICLSPTAIAEVKRLKRKHLKSTNGFLRIGIQAKGCAGLSYQLDFAESMDTNDQVFSCDDQIQVAVNRQNLSYVDGLTLDYSEDLMGGSFRFHNPNAHKTCSCGHSFAVEPIVLDFQV